MPQEDTYMNIGNAAASDMSSAVDDVTVSQQTTDSATGTGEYSYTIEDWEKWYGYYLTIPEVKTAIDTRAIWTVGKKWTTQSKRHEIRLNSIKGWGEDTFQTILQNMVVVKRICGDAFAEIIRDDKGKLLNLKPLDPSTMRIVVDKKGLLKRYEQTSKIDKSVKKFQPYDIFHLVNKRVADEIHGRSDIEAIEEIILASNENFTDMKQVFHRHVKPIMAFKLDTDDSTKISAFRTKMDDAINEGENIYIPKDTVEFELVTVPSSATLSPFSWIDNLRTYFYQVVGIPQIILGNAPQFSESAAKIAYLSFQQSVEAEQLQIETGVFKQLGFKIKLEFPATIQNELISDTKKDGANQQMGIQEGEMAVKPTAQEGGE